MSFIPYTRETTRFLKPGYSQALDFVRDSLGMDPMMLVNAGLLVAAIYTFLAYMSNISYKYAQGWLASTVRIDDDDLLYQSVMRWMADHQFLNRQFRSVRAVSTAKSSWEDEEEALKSLAIPLKEPDPNNLISYRAVVGRTPISLQPFQGTHIFRQHGSWILFKHRVNSGNQLVQLPKERGYIQLQCLGFSTVPLQRFIEETQLYNIEQSMKSTNIFRAISNVRDIVRWNRFTGRPSRDISTVILEREKKQALLRDINEYLHPYTRRWYANHGIPYRRGYLFSGAPGTGKTSLTAALAGIFGLDIYVLSLLDPNLNESQLMRLMSEIPSRCIVLLEDVDAAGLSRPDNGDILSAKSTVAQPKRRRNAPQEDSGTIAEIINGPASMRAPVGTSNNTAGPQASVSLSGLLNAIDGVSSQEGRILIMTTNSPELLDKALIRPGRVDMHIVFELPAKEEMCELFLAMYNDDAPKQNPVIRNITLEKGHSSTREENPTSLSETLRTTPSTTTVAHETDKQKKQKEINEMAEIFANSIPERELSLAALQGYLLQYKRQPQEACENAAKWAKEALKKMNEDDEENHTVNSVHEEEDGVS
jgi:mitochondrial chaperone BCS1